MAKKEKKRASTVLWRGGVGNYEKHPFFAKKTNAAKALLKIVGLPKQLAEKAQA